MQRNSSSSALPQSQRLEGLDSLHDFFQVENFNKALSGSRPSRLTRMFSGGKPGAVPSAIVAAAGGVNSPASTPLTLNEILQYQPDAIPTSLLRLGADNSVRAVKLFGGIQRFATNSAGMTQTDMQNDAARYEVAAKLLQQAIKRTELRDELYMQLLKQTRGAPPGNAASKVWQLFYLLACVAPASKPFIALVCDYVHAAAAAESEAVNVDGSRWASKTWAALKHSAKAGARHQAVTAEEVEAQLGGKPLTAVVFFLDGTFEEMTWGISTTVANAVVQLAGLIKLTNYETFTLFESRKVPAVDEKHETTGALVEETVQLDDNKYVADALAEAHASQDDSGSGLPPSRLLFKKRMFRETDEAISEPMFISLSFVQAQHDYLAGLYPVVNEDAAQMAALQIHADFGTTLLEDESGFESAMEQFVTNEIIMSRPRQEWIHDIYSRYHALEHFSQEDARLQFLRILRTLPYGNSAFFKVKRIEDPISLLPETLILGINKRGVHFFRPVPKQYLHSAELRDIMQFGSSTVAVFFKMRVAGVLHVFQFDTRQGEDICMALQTHINDIMIKRLTASKSTASSAPVTQTTSGDAGGRGPQYDSHITSMQTKLDAANNRVEALQSAAAEAASNHAHVTEALAEAQERLDMIDNNRAFDSNGKMPDISNKLHEIALLNGTPTMRRPSVIKSVDVSCPDTSAAKNNEALVVDMLADTSEAVAPPPPLQSAPREAKGLQDHITSLTAELTVAKERIRSLEVTLRTAIQEAKLLANKASRAASARETETAAAAAEVAAARTELKGQLASKDGQVNGLVQELAATQLQLSDTEAQLQQYMGDIGELDELRELKNDVDRREKNQAALIETQAKRLGELDKLYRDEALERKKTYNAMEDLKGKIRVYARIRPMLSFEEARGQLPAVTSDDELSISHMWKGARKDYSFDAVFTPGTPQEEVFEGTRKLVRSAVDGYNVCIFAYGQTGSGKTFTMAGTPEQKGLAPRGVDELFALLNADARKASYQVTVYMLELYCDEICDLLRPSADKQAGGSTPEGKSSDQLKSPGQARSPSQGKAPRLDVKKDSKGMVTIPGATILEVTSAKQLWSAIESGQKNRHVAATQMNRESSRSHLITSIVITSTNLQTQNVTRGKLSFVDLAGSERVKKSGSEGDQLKEAQAINKSLSALGDVISALASEQVHIPYRNHKLTMLMSDSLGGTAKTLMFVNVSPTDGNLDETQSSLTYATRVRTIKNDVTRNEVSKDVIRLRQQVEHWRTQAGLDPEQRALVDLTDIQDRRQVPSPESAAALS